MTLPFISYGGSSMISLAYGMGMLVALTRTRPRAEALASRTHFSPPQSAAQADVVQDEPAEGDAAYRSAA